MRKTALPFLLLGACSFAHANEELYTSRFSACMDRSGGVTIEMLDCIAEERKITTGTTRSVSHSTDRSRQ